MKNKVIARACIISAIILVLASVIFFAAFNTNNNEIQSESNMTEYEIDDSVFTADKAKERYDIKLQEETQQSAKEYTLSEDVINYLRTSALEIIEEYARVGTVDILVELASKQKIYTNHIIIPTELVYTDKGATLTQEQKESLKQQAIDSLVGYLRACGYTVEEANWADTWFSVHVSWE